MRAIPDDGQSSREAKVFAFLKAKSEDALVGDCAKTVAPSVKPCTEYEFGTDTAIQCTQRYLPAAIKGFLFVRCLQALGVKVRDDMPLSELQPVLAKLDRFGDELLCFTFTDGN